MSGDLFIKNGVVMDPARKLRAQVNGIVRQGQIVEWTKSRTAPADCTVLDVAGAIVSPGWIDMHTHLRDPGLEYKEDIASGTAAAAAGGFTAVACMANTDPVNDCAAVTNYIRERAASVGRVRVYPVGAISRGLKGEALADIGDLHAAGVVGLSDDGKTVMNSLLMRRAMEYARDFDLPIIVHCEDHFLCQDAVMHEGAVSTRLGLRGCPAESEEIIIRRDIALARLTGAHLHVQHVSCVEGVKAVALARAERTRVTAEASPHHLLLTDEALVGFDPNFRVNPPLRTTDDRSAVRKALRDGVIQAIATDHAPHAVTEKDEVAIEDAACGMIGLESALPVCLRLVEEKVITLPRLIELFTSGPAGILRVPGGSLAVGRPADITIFDPRPQVVIRKAAFRSKSRNTGFEGWKCHGRVRYTIVGGEIVYHHPAGD